MSACFTHNLEMNREESITHSECATLSIVDLESYQTYVGRKTDDLDLMVHLQNQMNALAAFAWDVPERPLSLRFIVTGDHQAMQQITFANRPPSASGTVRTHGSLCLVGHDRLMDCARNREHGLLKGGRPHVLNVPPGIYYLLIYYRFPYPNGNHPGYTSSRDGAYDYTVYLHHYPHPAPRVAPVRLSPGLIPWAGKKAAEPPWAGSRSGVDEVSPIEDHFGKPLGSV